MKTQPQNKPTALRFRRWSRAGYAIFRSLGNVVTIGCLHAQATDQEQLKAGIILWDGTTDTRMLPSSDDNPVDDELLLTQPSALLLSLVQPHEQAAAACEKASNVDTNSYTGGCCIIDLQQPLFYYPFNMKKIFLGVVLALASMTGTVCAQNQNDSLAVNLNQVSVNARRNQLYSQLGRVVTIIEQEQIRRSAVQSIDQLLDYVAGVDVRQRGVNTTQADISVRGGTFDQVLVLLNGVNITDPQTGHFNLDIPLNISDISRVEILQGSAARVLGPNAFSGAINIVTETGGKKSLRAELTGGSFNTFGQSVAGTIGNEKLSTFATLTHKSSSGYMHYTDFDLSNAFIQSVLNTESAGKFSLQIAGQLKDMGANGFYSLKYPDQREANKTLLTALDWQYNKGNFSLDAQASWRSHYDRYELVHNTPTGALGYKYHLSNVLNGKVNGSYRWMAGKTTLGVNVRNEHIYSSSLGIKMTNDSVQNIFDKDIYYKYSYNRTVYSAMLDHSVKLGKWYLSAGLAASYSEDFSTRLYGGFDLGYMLNEQVKLYVSGNSATRLPTFTDLFFANAVQQGNPDLKPETSKVAEVGVKMNKTNWTLNADVYYRHGNNVIDWVKTSSTSSKYVSMNLSEVNATGGDITAEYRFDRLFIRKFSVAYSYLTLDKSVEGFDSKYALDYLRNKLSVGLNHQIAGNVSAGWNATYNDRAGTYDANTVIGAPSAITHYKPFWLLDLRILWNMKKLDVFADANNLLDKKYADYGGLTQPGINFNLGLRLKL